MLQHIYPPSCRVTYSVDAVQLLCHVEQNDGEKLPADTAISKKLPWFLGLETC